MDGTKTLLLQAGLPPGFWPYAIKAYSFAQNIDVVNGDSAWHRRHNQGQFKGRTIPFGCLVHFKPQPDVKKKMFKGAPDSVAGVFFGYKVQPGGVWDNEYKVVDLRDFKGMDFSRWRYPANVRQQTVREVVWKPKDPFIFPLYEKYTRANDTIEGIEGHPEDEPEQGELFAEVHGPLPAPAEAGGAPVPVVPPPNAPADPTITPPLVVFRAELRSPETGRLAAETLSDMSLSWIFLGAEFTQALDVHLGCPTMNGRSSV